MFGVKLEVTERVIRMPLPDEESLQKHLDTFTHGLSLHCIPKADASPSTASAAATQPLPVILESARGPHYQPYTVWHLEKKSGSSARRIKQLQLDQTSTSLEAERCSKRNSGQGRREQRTTDGGQGPLANTSPLSPSVRPHTLLHQKLPIHR